MTRETAMRAASYLLTIKAAKAHLSALLNGRRTEAFADLYLNSKNRLVGEDVWEGSIDRIHIYPREVVRRALMLDASVTLVAHNHPNGDPTPSAADKKFTQKLELALLTVDAILLDQLIFGVGKPFSFVKSGEL